MLRKYRSRNVKQRSIVKGHLFLLDKICRRKTSASYLYILAIYCGGSSLVTQIEKDIRVDIVTADSLLHRRSVAFCKHDSLIYGTSKGRVMVF